MRTFENQEFRRFDDRDSGATFANVEFRGCSFQSCIVSMTDQVKKRSTIRGVRIVDCEALGCSLRTAVLDDVTVDGLKTNALLVAHGCAYRHVTLRGRLGKLVLSEFVPPIRDKSDEYKARVQAEFTSANAKLYGAIDWALDISEADANELDIQAGAVPGHLVRRDSRTQCLIKREKVIDRSWEKLDLSTLAQVKLNDLVSKTHPSLVFVAAKRASKFRTYVDDIKRLRDAGVAELD